MKVMTYEGIVENGCVHIPAEVSLPEKTKVYIVVPGGDESKAQRVTHISSPRLAHPKQANDFIKEVKEVVDVKE